MKTLKVLIIAVVAVFAFGSAKAQVRVGVHIGDRRPVHRVYVQPHRRVVVVHRRYHRPVRRVVVVHHRY